MSFLYPHILWFLAALLIPIAVHLFNFRRHKLVYFSNTTLLKAIQQENAKTKKLKYLVTLFLRCLFIIALVFAFAFPFKPEKTAKINTDEGLVGIYLDNSMSMKAQSSKTTLLEDARKAAKDMVGKCSPSTRFLLMTNSFETQNEYPMNQEEMLGQIDRMNLDGMPVKMNEVIERFTMLRKRHGFDQAALFAYSDFQKNMLDLSGIQADSSLQIVAIPCQAEQRSNISVDTVWLGSPVVQAGLANEVLIRLSNRGDKTMKGLPVNMSVDGKVTASATVDIEANGSAELAMQLLLNEKGFARCAVSINDYPMVFDDIYRFVVELKPNLNVVELIGGDETSSLALIFGDDPQFNYLRMDPSRIDLPSLSKAHLVVVSETSTINETVRQTLIEDAVEGASVVFFHDDGRTVDTNAMAVSDIAKRHDFFSDIILDLPQDPDLPQVHRHLRLTPDAKATTLMHLENGDPLLILKPEGKGRVFDVATTLDAHWSNLATHSLFVPMMLKMAFLGGGVGRISYTIGDDKTLIINNINNNDLRIRSEEVDFEMIPAHELRSGRVFLSFQDEIPVSGFYDLVANDSIADVMAWNDSRKESDLQVVSQEELKEAFSEAGLEVAAVLSADALTDHGLAQAMARQSTLWRWFVLLALLALLGEILVLRFWK